MNLILIFDMGIFNDLRIRLFHSVKVEFLGPKNAGKTTFISSLGAQDVRPGEPTNNNYYDGFYVTLPDDKTIYIKRGRDDGGGETKFIKNYTSAVKEGDFVIYLLDIKQYFDTLPIYKQYEHMEDAIKDEVYAAIVLSQIPVLFKHTTQKMAKKVSIILTHSDEVDGEVPENLVDQFMKSYPEQTQLFLMKHCYALDARKKKQVGIAFKKIIGI